MNNAHEIHVTPASKREQEVLAEIEAEFDKQRGDGQAAVFGQLWVEGTVGRFKARVFSGPAMKYLHRHLHKAMEMQDRDQTGPDTSE